MKMVPQTKKLKPKMVRQKLAMVTGCLRLLPFFWVSHLKIKGGIMYAISTTENMPMMVTSASDFMAGCLAKISMPMPMNMMEEERMMEFLNCDSIGRP